ncbi:MAG: GAF domain-containing protein [Acidimicrobiia bacterium]|nr:GAF domain-containing protein [Acidimicrobiia bacterium]
MSLRAPNTDPPASTGADVPSDTGILTSWSDSVIDPRDVAGRSIVRRTSTAAGDAYLAEVVRDRGLGLLATAIRVGTLVVGAGLLALDVAPRDVGAVVAATLLVLIAVFRALRPIRVEGRPLGIVSVGVELAATVLAIVISGGWDSAFVLTPAAPIIVAGLGAGYVAAFAATTVAVGGIMVGEVIQGTVGTHARSGAQLALVFITISAACGFARRLARDVERRQTRQRSELRRLSEVNDLLRVLQELSRSLPATLDLTDVLGSTRTQIRRITEYTSLVVILRREATSEWSVEMADGTRLGRSLPDAELPDPAAIALAEDRAVLENDLFVAGKTGISPSARSALYIPLAARDTVIGLLALEHRRARTYGADEVRILSGLATPVALAIDNAVMFARIRTLGAEEERARIARELHDNLAQSLAYVAFELERLSADDTDGQLEHLREIVRKSDHGPAQRPVRPTRGSRRAPQPARGAERLRHPLERPDGRRPRGGAPRRGAPAPTADRA